MLTITNNLSIIPGTVPVIVDISQYDKGLTELVFKMQKQSGEFDCTGLSATCEGKAEDGTLFRTQGVVSGSSVTVTLTEEMSAIQGRAKCKLIFTDAEGQRVASAKFYLDTEEIAEGEVTPADIPLAQKLIEENNKLNARFDVAIAGATQDSEVEDIRVGADGVTYPSAGTSVRGQVSQLSESITNFSEGYQTMNPSDFVRGSISGNGTESPATHRMRSATYQFTYPVTLKVKGAYQFGVFFYDGSTFKGFYAFAKNDVFIPPNKQFRVVIRRDDNAYMELDEPKHMTISTGYVYMDKNEYADWCMLADLTGNITYSRCTTQKTYTNSNDVRVRVEDPTIVFRVYATTDGINFTNICDWVNDFIIPSGTQYKIAMCMRDNHDANIDINARYSLTSVDIGYSVPRGYYMEEIEDTLEKVSAKTTEPSLVFFLASDLHYQAHQYFRKIKADSVTDMVSNMKYLASRMPVDGFINLGDNVDCMNVTTDVSQEQIDYVNRMIKSMNLPILFTIGNHDDNHYVERWDNKKLYANNVAYVRNDRVSNTDVGVYGTDYYVDFPNYNIRVISLNAISYGDYVNTNSKYGYSDQTCQWFQNIMRSTNDMGVIVLTHTSPIFSNNGWQWEVGNIDEIKNTIKEYVDSGKNYICTLYGHSHLDYHATSPWLEITLPCQKGDYMTDEYASTSGLVGYKNPTRIVGTHTEDCWDVLIIKPFSGKIETIRFGAGEDRSFTFTPLQK